MTLISLFKKKPKNILFTTPSHNRKFFIVHKFMQWYKCDISETDTHNPEVEFERAEENAAKIYGTKFTKFLTNGSSSGIIGAVLACKPKKALLWANAHRCHLNAVRLAGAEPVFYNLEYSTDWGIPLASSPEMIEEELKKSGADAVIITSPSYEGIVSDTKKIKEICENYGAKLIVDEAHGALYPFSDKLPESAVKIADYTVQSLHKTAGGLNPTALLHSNDVDPQKALNMITTTSPSYPMLATIEANINYLNSIRGRKKIDELVENIKSLKFEKEIFESGDVTKILTKTEPDLIYEKFAIEDEKTNPKSTLFLCGLGTELKNLKRLERAINKV